MATEELIRESLKEVPIPGIKRDMARLNVVREVTVSNQRVNIILASTALNADVQNWVRTKAKMNFKDSLCQIREDLFRNDERREIKNASHSFNCR